MGAFEAQMINAIDQSKLPRMRASRMRPTLTVAISTVADRWENAEMVAQSLRNQDVDQILVIIQKCNDTTIQLLAGNRNNSSYSIVADREMGLSRSRNIAIEKTRSDYVWTVDDDVEIVPQACARIKELVASPNDVIYLARVGNRDDVGSYTRPRKKGRIGWLYLCRANSIELILPVKEIGKRQLRFDTRIGLGTTFPTGEENLFLLNAVSLGMQVVDLGETLIRHPKIATPSKINRKDDERRWQVRGHIASKFGPPIAFALGIRWCARRFFNADFITACRNLLRGYKCKTVNVLTGIPDSYEENGRCEYMRMGPVEVVFGDRVEKISKPQIR